MRCHRVSLVAIALGLASVVVAQTIHCVPPKDCSNGVQFLPTQAEYAAAVGGTLSSTSPTTPIAFQVLQDKSNAYSLEVSRSPWSSSMGMTLEARITLSGPKTSTTVLDWAPVSTVPATLFTHDVNKTDVAVEYRIGIDGRELPGTYTTTVTFRAWDANGPKHQGKKVRDTISTAITVTIPAYLSLLLDGVPVGQTASVDFEYTPSNLVAYLQAVQTGALLPMTKASFSRLAISTNNPTGYRVKVSIVEAAGPAASTLDASDIRLFGGVQANGYVFSSSSATDGYVTLLAPSDFGLHVDGGEAAGAYTFTATYVAQPNP